MNNIKLEKTKALVLCGIRYGEMEKLARKIASKYGSFTETNIDYFSNPSKLQHILDTEPDTLIVNGFPNSKKKVLVDLILDDLSIPVDVLKGGMFYVTKVKSPYLIFLCDECCRCYINVTDKVSGKFNFVYMQNDRHGFDKKIKNSRMDKQSAIERIKGITGGDGIYRSRSCYPESMKGEIAKQYWDDGVFTLGFEYGYIQALMDAFGITEDDLYSKK